MGAARASLADVSERRRRWSGSTKAVSIDETDEGTEIEDTETPVEDPKLKVKEEGKESSSRTLCTPASLGFREIVFLLCKVF